MHTDQIYIARNGKSGMHVLVRILAVDDIGVDYPPIDPDNFNKLMMARDVKSLVLAARDLGPMYISADILSRRTFIPICCPCRSYSPRIASEGCSLPICRHAIPGQCDQRAV